MVSDLSVANKETVAKRWGKRLEWEKNEEMNNLNAWLHRIREKRREYRVFLNTIVSLERRNPRLKKILLSASENDLDLIDDPSELES